MWVAVFFVSLIYIFTLQPCVPIECCGDYCLTARILNTNQTFSYRVFNDCFYGIHKDSQYSCHSISQIAHGEWLVDIISFFGYWYIGLLSLCSYILKYWCIGIISFLSYGFTILSFFSYGVAILLIIPLILFVFFLLFIMILYITGDRSRNRR